MKIGIIGAGVAGLAAAVRLSIQGHDVEVFEQRPLPGGKLTEFSVEGYRFDFSPSLGIPSPLSLTRITALSSCSKR